MHLRDSEGGGTAYQETGLTDGATNGLTNGNSTVNPSSTRTVVVTSRAESTAGVSDFRHELLLAWLLVLHRNNDDGLSKVNWGFRTRDDQEPSSATHNSLSLSEAPFKNSDSIAEALEVIKELGESGLESETQTIPVIYFNNGAPRSQGNSEKAPSKRSQDVRRRPSFVMLHILLYNIRFTMLTSEPSGHTRSRRRSTRTSW